MIRTHTFQTKVLIKKTLDNFNENICLIQTNCTLCRWYKETVFWSSTTILILKSRHFILILPKYIILILIFNIVYPWIEKFYHWVSSLSKLEMEIWNKFAAKFSQIATKFQWHKILEIFLDLRGRKLLKRCQFRNEQWTIVPWIQICLFIKIIT